MGFRSATFLVFLCFGYITKGQICFDIESLEHSKEKKNILLKLRIANKSTENIILHDCKRKLDLNNTYSCVILDKEYLKNDEFIGFLIFDQSGKCSQIEQKFIFRQEPIWCLKVRHYIEKGTIEFRDFFLRKKVKIKAGSEKVIMIKIKRKNLIFPSEQYSLKLIYHLFNVENLIVSNAINFLSLSE